MSKIRSYDELEERINKSSQKRKREISSLKVLCDSYNKKNSYEKDILYKSLIVISYSHFEGFVRDSTRCYFEYLNNQSITSDKVSLKLLSSYIQYLYFSNTNGKLGLLSDVDKLMSRSDKISFNLKFFSDTESNLKYEVLQKMLLRSGFDENQFVSEKVFIDNVILKNRNEFAHGDSLYEVDGDKASEIASKIIEYIDKYSAIVLNAVSLNEYKR